MNILVIGGTRLLGLAMVKKLLLANHNVTVLSHRPEKCPSGAECIAMERSEGLIQMTGRKFDITIDFIAYDNLAPTQAFNCIHPGIYILISSAWIVRLSPYIGADEPISVVNESHAKILPNGTYSYLTGKMRAEAAVMRIRKKNGTATILRLPIFWGYEDHTGRFDFYLKRITDGEPVICVDGGNNYVQLVWTEDIARVATSWLHKASERPVWEAIPDKGTKVRDVIELITIGAGKQTKLVDISSKQLHFELPGYLRQEPLWRETSASVTTSNLFSVLKTEPTPLNKWLCDLSRQEVVVTNMSELRKQEILFLSNLLC